MIAKGGYITTIEKLDRKFETGMPIPTDQPSSMEVWKPYLKGLTLISQEEKGDVVK